jgi:hypothetical protein
MPSPGTVPSAEGEQLNIAHLMAEIATAGPQTAVRSAAALTQVRRAIITGEGPMVAGRIHFSRTIDFDDVSLCARILIVAGHDGEPVSRVEADALLDINAAGSERPDDGCFDDLLAKAVMHHVTSACGGQVPPREIALARETGLHTWTSAVNMNADVSSWLETRLREVRRSNAAVRAISEAICGTGRPNLCQEVTIGAVFDLAA